MRDIERAAIDSGAVTGLELMERAGQGVVEAVFEEWPELATGAHRAVVLCGPGNNGGDGFVVARLLRDAGWVVEVFAQGWDMLWKENHVRPDAPPDALNNALKWQACGGRTAALNSNYGLKLCEPGHILVVDALLGIGQNRDTSDILRNWGREWDLMCNISPANTVTCLSIDVPTGYDTDSGRLLSDHPFEADLTVTFHRHKPVHECLARSGGRFTVKDIGLYLPNGSKTPPED
jgi:hydroxyethylthiazole kinase-like uncharacterized protein yjeF